MFRNIRLCVKTMSSNIFDYYLYGQLKIKVVFKFVSDLSLQNVTTAVGKDSRRRRVSGPGVAGKKVMSTREDLRELS